MVNARQGLLEACNHLLGWKIVEIDPLLFDEVSSEVILDVDVLGVVLQNRIYAPRFPGLMTTGSYPMIPRQVRLNVPA